MADEFKYATLDQPKQQSEEDAHCAHKVATKFLQEAMWRNTFASQFDEVAQVIFPEHRNTFFYGNYNFPGLKKTDRQVDASGMLALWRWGAICDSLLTPASMQWHGLEASNPDVMKDRATRLWFEDVTRRLFKARYTPTANFVGQNIANYLQLGAFGTMGMFIDEFDDPIAGRPNGLRYHAVPMGELFITQNHQGLVDGFTRWMKMTARQVFVQFGPDRFPQTMKPSLEADSEMLFDVLHQVCRRADYDPARTYTKQATPWASYYVAMDSKILLQEGGYYTFPLPIGRYMQAPWEVYGRSWAMMALPSLKTLNDQKRTYLKVGHRQGDPILLAADDGLMDKATLKPGSVIPNGIDPLTGHKLIDILPTGNIQTTLEMMQEERGIIDEMSFGNLFKVLTDNPMMSATAVVELANQKGMLLAPTMGRIQSEYLGSMIDRELDVMSRLRDNKNRPVLPPMPPALKEADGEYETIYTSPLSRTARAGDVAGFMHLTELYKELAQSTGDPAWLDPINTQRSSMGLADRLGAPASFLSTPQEQAQKVKGRQQQQQQENDIKMAPARASMAATAAKQQGQAQGAQPFAPINLQQPQGQQ